MKASIKKHILHFKRPSGTSRGILTEKPAWFLILKDGDHTGIGEVSLLPSLSYDDRPGFEEKIEEVVIRINSGCNPVTLKKELLEWPSILFAFEIALKDLEKGQRLLFPSDFTNGEKAIPINGLIWMGQPEFMRQQIQEKLELGFSCLKMKIGAIDFQNELEILKEIRKHFSPETIEIRVDANGAFSPEQALKKLEQLAPLHIHSIEQPIRQGHWEAMAQLCDKTPLPIALDEELIGISDPQEKMLLLDTISPHYIILKPGLLGGFKSCEDWISLTNERQIGWWVTSALESNIGLSAIAQWTFQLNTPMLQGLGTGMLYTNNIPSPLFIDKGALHYHRENRWDLSQII